MELENDDTDAEYGAIEDLVDGLNDAAGAGTYDFIDTGIVGTDAIRVGIIYKPASVTPVGSHEIIDSSVDPSFIDNLNRPSIAQTFEVNANGAGFTVVVNHLKSKGSDCDGVRRPRHRRRPGQLQRHPHDGGRGAGRLARDRPDRQRRHRLSCSSAT